MGKNSILFTIKLYTVERFLVVILLDSSQENELSSVITQTVPLEWTHQELSFEWSHL